MDLWDRSEVTKRRSITRVFKNCTDCIGSKTDTMNVFSVRIGMGICICRCLNIDTGDRCRPPFGIRPGVERSVREEHEGFYPGSGHLEV
uniref:Uncharacterized protein n=1 Tax=Arundo donax TaxID=35708 RepID=A0A0A8ZC92_ARUDO